MKEKAFVALLGRNDDMVEPRLLESLLTLPETDRAELAYQLLNSLGSPMSNWKTTESWNQEIARRVAEIKTGNYVAHDAADVIAELRERLRASKA